MFNYPIDCRVERNQYGQKAEVIFNVDDFPSVGDEVDLNIRCFPDHQYSA